MIIKTVQTKIIFVVPLAVAFFIIANYASIGAVKNGKLVTASAKAKVNQGMIPLFVAKTKSNTSAGSGRPTQKSTGRPTQKKGGSRGCPVSQSNIPPNSEDKKEIIALIPDDAASLTIKTHPTIWVYVPYTPEQVNSGEFSLQESGKEDDIYRVKFTLGATPGIVSITIPSTESPLEINKEYEWHFKLNCPPVDGSDIETAFVVGEVQRISLNLQMESELNAAKTSEDRIAFYARNNIWYDRLDELSLINPKNATPNRQWTELLESVGLRTIAQKPIVGSVENITPVE